MFAAREEQSVVVGTASRAVLSASPCCRVPGVKWSRDSFPPCFRAPSVYATTCAPSRRRGGGVFGGCSHARVCACVRACDVRACGVWKQKSGGQGGRERFEGRCRVSTKFAGD